MSALPDTATPGRAQLGALLVERGFLSEDDLTLALEHQAQESRPLGEILVQRGLVTAPVIAQALATQHGSVLKTEYGFATGFDVRLTEATSDQPPISPDRAEAPGLSLRIADPVSAPTLRAPQEELSPAGSGPARVTQAEALELELAEAVAENGRLRSRLGELQLREVGLRGEHESLRCEAAVVGARVAGLEAAVAALQAEKAQLTSLVALLQRQLEGCTGPIT
jgi:hypothetical protein